MSIKSILKRLNDAGIQLSVDGDVLEIKAPKGVLTDDLRALLVDNKTEIIDSLKLATVSSTPITPLAKRADADKYPLSAAQERLWLITRLEADSAAYTVPFALRISGALDIAALQQAINHVIQRHETLRATFSTVGGLPVQTINNNFKFKLDVESITGNNRSVVDSLTLQCVRDAFLLPINIYHDQLIQARLLCLEEQEYVLVITMHHIVSDGWSIAILFNEISDFYRSYLNKKLPDVDPLPIQYADFADWQRLRLSEPEVEGQLAYWETYLDNFSPLELPLDRRRKEMKGYQGATLPFQLSNDLVEAIKRTCVSEKITLSMLLSAVYSILLHKFSAQDDIIFGTPVANRNITETESLIGFFVNMLVVRADLSANPTIKELFQQVAKNAIASYENQDIPFEQIVDALQPERSQNQNPIFQVILALQSDNRIAAAKQSMSTHALTLDGCKVSDFEMDVETTRFDIELHVAESQSNICGAWIYDKDLFNPATIKSMNDALMLILKQVVQKTDSHVSDISYVSESQVQSINKYLTQTQTPYPDNETICELFEKQVEESPNAIAVSFNGLEISYRTLNNRSNQLAHYLRARGVTAEDMVGLSIEKSIDMIVALLGILKVGGAYVPLDPEYPENRLKFMLADTAVSVVITHSNLKHQLPEFTGDLLCIDQHWPLIEKESCSNPQKNISASSLMYVIYTSGSTGQPKGVCVEHRSAIRLVKNTNYINIKSDDVFLQVSPVAFDASTFEIWGCLLNGARLVLYPEQKIALEPLADVIKKYEINTLWLTTGLFNQMIDQQLDSFRQVKNLLAGGEAASITHVKKYLSYLNDNSSDNHRLIHCYGPTENTTFTSCHVMDWNTQLLNTVPIGKPISNTSVFILDKNCQAVASGVTGELYTGGAGLARGYLNQDELTRDTFGSYSGVMGTNTRLYRTGDLVKFREGAIEFVGRKDNQIKLRGFRVEIGEVETCLKRARNVVDAVVLLDGGREERKRLIAYLVSSADSNQIIASTREYIKSQLPSYMVPSIFILVDKILLTQNGKVDYKKLPKPNSERQVMTELVTPAGELEVEITKIWQVILKIEETGVEDNFFDLGGDSFLLIQLHAQLEKALSREIPITDLFKYPTIRSFSEQLSNPSLRLDESKNLQSRVSKQRAAMNKFKRLSR